MVGPELRALSDTWLLATVSAELDATRKEVPALIGRHGYVLERDLYPTLRALDIHTGHWDTVRVLG